MWLNEKLIELNIVNKNYLITSDNASNLFAAFKNNRIPYICHCLNLAIQSAINDSIDENTAMYIPEFKNFL